MSESHTPLRFIFKTSGVCPPEIHFQVDQDILTDLRFVGGGCPGNAHLVARLLRGRPLDEVVQVIDGIECRNGTSCPAQLAVALRAALDGRMTPADSFRLVDDPADRRRVGVVGELAGNPDNLGKIIQHMSAFGIEAIYCLGNLTGEAIGSEFKQIISLVRKNEIIAIQGENDWNITQRKSNRVVQDWIIQLPQVLTFHLGAKRGVAFFGDFLLKLPGFSDFEPFALEMNMVCHLTDFMQDESVFPALEAMIPQFQGDIILFSQIRQWGHWSVGGKDFISAGPAADQNGLSWGLVESVDGKTQLDVIRVV